MLKRERWNTYHQSLVHLDGFVRRGGYGVFVYIGERAMWEIFVERRWYNFWFEALHKSTFRTDDCIAVIDTLTNVFSISFRLGLFDARTTRLPTSFFVAGI